MAVRGVTVHVQRLVVEVGPRSRLLCVIVVRALLLHVVVRVLAPTPTPPATTHRSAPALSGLGGHPAALGLLYARYPTHIVVCAAARMRGCAHSTLLVRLPTLPGRELSTPAALAGTTPTATASKLMAARVVS